VQKTLIQWEAVADSATNKNSSRVGWLAGWFASAAAATTTTTTKTLFFTYLLTSPAGRNDCQNFAHEIECRCQPAG
jgi:hypothetical protein